jgi:hypothetical protein
VYAKCAAAPGACVGTAARARKGDVEASQCTTSGLFSMRRRSTTTRQGVGMLQVGTVINCKETDNARLPRMRQASFHCSKSPGASRPASRGRLNECRSMPLHHNTWTCEAELKRKRAAEACLKCMVVLVQVRAVGKGWGTEESMTLDYHARCLPASVPDARCTVCCKASP